MHLFLNLVVKLQIMYLSVMVCYVFQLVCSLLCLPWYCYFRGIIYMFVEYFYAVLMS